MDEYTDITIDIPEKGRDVHGYDSFGNEHYCFRCACHNLNCMEWRCSFTRMVLMIDIVKWRYL